jgi:phosphoribosylanthranilate isomerase
MLKNSSVNKLFFLSGGIEPGDTEKLRSFSGENVARKLFSVDINSKFETSAGVKDMEKVKEFVSRLKG